MDEVEVVEVVLVGVTLKTPMSSFVHLFRWGRVTFLVNMRERGSSPRLESKSEPI